MTATAYDVPVATPIVVPARVETFDILHFDALEDVRAWLTTLPKDQQVAVPGNQSACLVHNYATYKLTGNPNPVDAIEDGNLVCYQHDYSYMPRHGQWQSHNLNGEMAHLSYSFDNIGRKPVDENEDSYDGNYKDVTVAQAIDLVDTLIESRGSWSIKDDDD